MRVRVRGVVRPRCSKNIFPALDEVPGSARRARGALAIAEIVLQIHLVGSRAAAIPPNVNRVGALFDAVRHQIRGDRLPVTAPARLKRGRIAAGPARIESSTTIQFLNHQDSRGFSSYPLGLNVGHNITPHDKGAAPNVVPIVQIKRIAVSIWTSSTISANRKNKRVLINLFL